MSLPVKNILLFINPNMSSVLDLLIPVGSRNGIQCDFISETK